MGAAQQIMVAQKIAAGGGGGITLVASASAGSVNTTSATTGSANTTGATLLVAWVADVQAGSTAVTDSKGNTWTGGTKSTATTAQGQFFTCVPSSVGSGHTFTATGTGSTYPSIVVLAFSGTHATPGDQVSGATAGATNTIQPGSITPSQDNCLVVTGFAGYQSTDESISAGYTDGPEVQFLASNHFGAAVAYKVQTSAAAENPTWTGAFTDAAARIASFKAA